MATCVLAISPRHLLYGNAAGSAIDPAHDVAKKNADIPQWDKSKVSGLQAIITGARFAALRTSGFAVGPWPDIDDQGWMIVVSDD